MTMEAHVLDFTPGAFLRRMNSTEDSQTAKVLEDMADGILAIDFALTFADFSYEARQLTLSILGLLGGTGGSMEAFDGELATHVNSSDRTIRRWRAAHLRESKQRRFSLLEITEGEYDGDEQRYKKTSYRFTAAAYVDAVVRAARASDLYHKNRRGAVERAAEEHYGDIPDAPPRQRHRKPRRSPTVRVEQAFVNAAKNVEKGRQALQDLSEDSRAALIEGRQGAELRETLLKLQADIGEILENFPQPFEGEEVDGGIGHFVRYPSSVPSAEDVVAWEQIERRAAGAPQVVTQAVNLHPPPTDEELEAEAICAEGCGELPGVRRQESSTDEP